MIKRTILIILTPFLVSCHLGKYEKNDLLRTIDNSFQLGLKQYLSLNRELPDSLFPRSVDPSGKLITCESGWWTSGFFPGSMWYLYEYFKDPGVLQAARYRTGTLAKEKYNSGDHDIGFKMFCSYGNCVRLVHDSSAIPVLITSANTLLSRYVNAVGCLRSWGNKEDQNECLVIIDNMMNLELLFWATEQTGDSVYYSVAVSHADNTLANHFRPDGSSYHVVVYDPKTGEVIQKRTHQGYTDESAWARGQAWGLYGYTMAYRKTGLKRYLDQAQKTADFIIHHPNIPADKIPYWDFNAPGIPDAPRDASAAAIMASALIELSDFTHSGEEENYLSTAEEMIMNLSRQEYRSKLNTNGNFLLMHGVGHLSANSEVDVPLSYADYYYLEAMIRLYKKYHGMF